MNRLECIGCVYNGRLNSNMWDRVCLFMHDTGLQRGCEPGKGCLRYTPGRRKFMEWAMPDEED